MSTSVLERAASPSVSRPWGKRLGYPALALALLAIPFFVTSTYYLHLVTVILIFGILLLGLDIVFGYTGEVSLGHAALLGIGAYTAGVLSLKLGWGILPAIPAAIVVASLFGRRIIERPALGAARP